MRAVARLHRVSLSTVQWWVQRAGDLPLDKVDWGNRSPIPARSARTAAVVEDVVLMLRRELKERSALGEYGARAIHSELVARRHAAVPSLRTIGRILERRGALDGGRRIRRNPPPAGWYLPEVAAGRAELDSSTSLRASLWKVACGSKCSMPSRCGAGCRAPGRNGW